MSKHYFILGILEQNKSIFLSFRNVFALKLIICLSVLLGVNAPSVCWTLSSSLWWLTGWLVGIASRRQNTWNSPEEKQNNDNDNNFNVDVYRGNTRGLVLFKLHQLNFEDLYINADQWKKSLACYLIISSSPSTSDHRNLGKRFSFSLFLFVKQDRKIPIESWSAEKYSLFSFRCIFCWTQINKAPFPLTFLSFETN